MPRKHQWRLETEGIHLKFQEDAIDEIANTAYLINEQMENIGARRLHTILEKLLEDISYNAPEMGEMDIVIDREYVEKSLSDMIKNKDLSKYII
jgi:ATP-dependent HslUV protease ATP-binding subunit HslU